MGSIRNPCDRYVSEWSYICEQNSNMPDTWEAKDSIPIGDCPDYKDNYTNVEGFQRWLNNNFGAYTRRFEWNYIEGGFSASLAAFDPAVVDCWVSVENLTASLRSCLHRYEY